LPALMSEYSPLIDWTTTKAAFCQRQVGVDLKGRPALILLFVPLGVPDCSFDEYYHRDEQCDIGYGTAIRGRGGCKNECDSPHIFSILSESCGSHDVHFDK